MVRKRFNIGPGGVLYAIVASLIILLGLFTQTNLLFWGFGLMVGGLIVSFVLSYLMMQGLTVQRILPGHGVVGEAMVLRYQITNQKSWMAAFGLVICESWGKGRRKTGSVANSPPRLAGEPFGWVLHLGTSQHVQTEAPCWPLARGYLEFDRVVLSTSFPFGIVRRTVAYELPDRMLIYPRLWRINRRILHRLTSIDPQGRRRLERPGGQEEFFGLRQYRAGDSMKLIDWKRSAKTGQLVTRELTQPSPPRLMVGLDLSTLKKVPDNGKSKRKVIRRGLPGWPTARSTENPTENWTECVESAVSLTASLVCDAYFHGYQVGLVVFGATCPYYPMHHSLPHRTKILESLALLELGTDTSTSNTIGRGLVRPTVLVVTDGADESRRDDQTIVMHTQHMQEYVLEIRGGSGAVLGPQVVRLARREQLREKTAWS